MSRKLIVIALFALAACSSKELELVTTEPVDVYVLPARPEVAGNRKLGELRANARVPVKHEVLQKDLAAYEVECTAPDGRSLRGYVLLGSMGLEVREARH